MDKEFNAFWLPLNELRIVNEIVNPPSSGAPVAVDIRRTRLDLDGLARARMHSGRNERPIPDADIVYNQGWVYVSEEIHQKILDTLQVPKLDEYTYAENSLGKELGILPQRVKQG